MNWDHGLYDVADGAFSAVTSFRGAYKGDLVISLQNWANAAIQLSRDSKWKPYSNYGSWIQSQGYGKTRTVIEYSKKTLTIGLDLWSEHWLLLLEQQQTL